MLLEFTIQSGDALIRPFSKCVAAELCIPVISHKLVVLYFIFFNVSESFLARTERHFVVTLLLLNFNRHDFFTSHDRLSSSGR